MRYFLFAIFALTSLSLSGQESERIVSFHSDITIHEDTSITVVETIKVIATGDQIKRGIYRDFPQLYKTTGGLRRARGFEVEKVLRDGKPDHYEETNIKGGIRVRIGRRTVMLDRGEHTYTIQYKTTRQLGYFESHDELYWNVTGNGWAFPIDKASATVTLPSNATPLELTTYTGAAGSKNSAATSVVRPNHTAHFETSSPLSLREGLTIVATWPKGAVNYEADPQGAGATMKDNPGIAIGILGLLGLLTYYYMTWLRVGKDPEAGTIIPLYGPPEGFSPAAVRNLYRMGFDDKVFSSAVIGLAAKGAITIKEQDKTYTLKKTKNTPELRDDELGLYKTLLPGVRSLKLTQSNHSTIGKAKSDLKKALSTKLEKTHFVKNFKHWITGLMIAIVPLAIAVFLRSPESLFILLWLSFWSIGTMALLSGAISSWRSGKNRLGATLFAIPFTGAWIGGVVAFAITVSIVLAAVFGVSIVIVFIFYHLLKAPTHCGREILDKIEGFKQYLSIAESDRLNLVNPPDRTPELFEEFLPYALALDVDQEWCEQFSDVLSAASQTPGEGRSRHYSPSFYSGNSNFNQMAAGAMTAAIAGSLTAALASSSVSPSSSSGSGGGGSSGGGGGGGGGGGW